MAQARELLRHARTEAAAAAVRALIELDFARRQLEIKDAAVADAERLLAKQRDKRGYGLVEASDLLQAESSLEARRTELALARSAVEKTRSAFIQASHTDRPDPAAGELSGLPDGEMPPGPGRRADLAAARFAREAAEWAERIERLDTLPDISLSGSYAATGLASRYGTSLDDAFGFDHAVKAVGLSFSVPIGYKKEALTRKAASLRAAQARAHEARLLENAEREVRDAREGLRLAKERLGLAVRLADIERRKLAAEEESYRKGRSSTDLVIRFQQDVRRAETELARARSDEALARVEAARASGTLLDGPLGEGL